MKAGLTRKERGLGKHDAPLKIQFQKGYEGFIHARIRNPYTSDTMMYREWERGFNTAYYDNLHRGKDGLRKRSKEARRA